jgi:hypothetical protein
MSFDGVHARPSTNVDKSVGRDSVRLRSQCESRRPGGRRSLLSRWLQPSLELVGASRAERFKAAHVLLYALLAVTPWLAFASSKLDSYSIIGDVRVSSIGALKDILVISYGLTLALLLARNRLRPRLRLNLWSIALVAFSLLVLVHLFQKPTASEFWLARTYILPLAFLLLIAWTPVTSRIVRNLTLIFLVNGVIFAILGIIEYAFSVKAFRIGERPIEIFPRSSSIFDSADTFASEIVLPIALAVAFFYSPAASRRGLVLYYAALGVLAAGIFLSASRAGMIALGLIVAALAVPRFDLRRLAATAILLVAIPLAILASNHSYSWHLYGGVKEALQMRLHLWGKVIDNKGGRQVIVSGEKLGHVKHTAATSGEATVAGKAALSSTTNSYLRLYVDLGIAAVLAYSLLALGVALAAATARGPLRSVTLALLIAFAVTGLLHDIILALPQMLFGALIIGLTLNPHFRREYLRGETPLRREDARVSQQLPGGHRI